MVHGIETIQRMNSEAGVVRVPAGWDCKPDPGHVPGKWQAFFVDIDGNKCSPAGPVGTFAGAVSFCRGYLSRGLASDVVNGSIPIPFRVDQPAKYAPMDEMNLDQSNAWAEVWRLFRELGMEVGAGGRGIDLVRDFINGLAKQSGKANGTSRWTGVSKGQSIMGVVNQHRGEQQQIEKPNLDYLVGPAINCKEPASSSTPASASAPAPIARPVATTLDDNGLDRVNKELNEVTKERDELEPSSFPSIPEHYHNCPWPGWRYADERDIGKRLIKTDIESADPNFYPNDFANSETHLAAINWNSSHPYIFGCNWRFAYVKLDVKLEEPSAESDQFSDNF